ncbi:MAG TPA: SRPBCC domain-containing protein [Micromonosporaceae bacterium]
MSRTFEATPARVWQALTSDSELREWYWPRSLDPTIAVDLRVDGAYRFASVPAEMAVSGRYLEIVPPSRLVSSWQWDGEDEVSTVTIELAGVGADRTEVTVTHTGLGPDEIESHEQGWSDCLNRLPAHLKS